MIQAQLMQRAAKTELCVCGHSWFILGVMIVHAPQVSPAQPQRLISDTDLGQVRLLNQLLTTRTLNIPHLHIRFLEKHYVMMH